MSLPPHGCPAFLEKIMIEKDDLLKHPDLKPNRHYETEGVVQHYDVPEPEEETPEEPLLPTIDKLSRLYDMLEILPGPEKVILQGVTKILNRITQGEVIRRIVNPPPSVVIVEPPPPPPVITVEPPPPSPPPTEKWPPPPPPSPQTEKWPPPPPLPPPLHPTEKWPPPPPPPPPVIIVEPPPPPPPPIEKLPPPLPTPLPTPLPPPLPTPPESEPEKTPDGSFRIAIKPVLDEDGDKKKEKKEKGEKDGDWDYDIYFPLEPDPHINVEPEKGDNPVDDELFGEDPGFDIAPETPRSLIDLSQESYRRDYNDLMADYTASVEQIVHRFFQMMLAIADDANMPDYTYLLKDFDAKAVKTSDKNLQHLKDSITKSQLVRDQATRQAQKVNTAENTLIRGRSWLAAQMQKERYLQEDYKVNTSTLCTTLGNDALLKARDEAAKKYDNGMYNMYKYLNNAVQNVSDLLDMRVSEASAKGQLFQNGANIFAKTPEPLPSITKQDDNSRVTAEAAGAVDKALKDQEAAISASYSSGPGSVDVNVPNVGVAPGKGAENIPKGKGPDWAIDMCVRCSKGCGIPADWIWAQFANESGYFSRPCASHNYGGMTEVGGGWKVFNSPEHFADFMATVLPRWVGSDGKGTTQAKTMREYCIALQTDTSPYCAEPAGVEPYYAAMLSCLGNQGTVL